MDVIFSLGAVERARSVHLLVQSFGATYICLWSYLPQPTHCLLFLDGYYQEEDNQPSSSSGSLARRLFLEYNQAPILLINGHVPGQAFINNRPYLELNELEVRRMASIDVQRRFYEEANIKTAVFMGCRRGEIEMGWSNATQINMENAMRTWFADVFPQLSPLRELSQAVDPNRPSSSSSSFNIDSPDSSSLLFSIPTPSRVPVALPEARPLPPLQHSSSSALAMQALQPRPSTSNALLQIMQLLQPRSSNQVLQQAMQSLQQMQSTTIPQEQALQAFARTRNIQLPSRESEEAAMTRAYLAILTSPSSSSSSTSTSSSTRARESAFKNYTSALAPTRPTRQASLRRQTMLNRAITYYRRLNIARREHMLSSRPTSTQLHHMISERKRREKINESFQALRSLLPSDAKKDKASVLTRTKEYITSLKGQVEELSKKYKEVQGQVSRAKEAADEEASLPSNQRLDVRIRPVPESASEQRILDLQVSLRGECPISDMVIRILEFLKQVKNVNLTSIEATTHVVDSQPFNRVVLRLNVEGDDWDESAFLEALRRVVGDLGM